MHIVCLLIVLAIISSVLLSRFFAPLKKSVMDIFGLHANGERREGKAPPANADVAYANYQTFQRLNAEVRDSLAKAIKADETRVDRSHVIVLYRRTLKLLNSALKIHESSCPNNKHAEVEKQRNKLLGFQNQALDRVQQLEEMDEANLLPKAASTSAVVNFRPLSSAAYQKARPASAFSHSAPNTSTAYPSLPKAALLKNVQAKYGEEILSTIVETTHTRISEVEGNAEAKAALEKSIVLPALNPALFTGLRAPCKGILLFGPPGNGKTMLAKAVANECHSTFFNVSAATIMSKWVGDGERLVQALFQVARNAQPSIIFIDEVDSMLCERSEQENGAARRVKTEFLVQLDGCSGSSDDRILVLAATNRPQELDEGILRRFPQRIFIDLPDQAARAKMIRRTFEAHKTKTLLSEQELDYIAARTDHYSYSDLMALCKAAAHIPIESVPKDKLRHCSADKLRPITADDLLTALRSIKPSSNPENRRKLIEFATNYAHMSG